MTSKFSCKCATFIPGVGRRTLREGGGINTALTSTLLSAHTNI